MIIDEICQQKTYKQIKKKLFIAFATNKKSINKLEAHLSLSALIKFYLI